MKVHGKNLFYFFARPADSGAAEPVAAPAPEHARAPGNEAAAAHAVLHIHFGMSGAFKTMRREDAPKPAATTRLRLESDDLDLVAHLSAMTVDHGDDDFYQCALCAHTRPRIHSPASNMLRPPLPCCTRQHHAWPLAFHAVLYCTGRHCCAVRHGVPPCCAVLCMRFLDAAPWRWRQPERGACREKIAKLGPDPLREDADAERLWETVQASKKPIGLVLMDQSMVAGLGNIYRAEVLFKVCPAPPSLPPFDCHGPAETRC